ncbi:MAG: HAMP domain-containing histidine kinase [Rhodospirillaceae bacterium]|nr:HAMP domain-containing histidine kinase [Rhodospirillaceae bacterium]
MSRGSLRLRLLLASTASIVLALVLAGVGLVALFGRHVERRIDDELGTYIRQLAGHLDFAPDGTIVLSADPVDPRFDEPLSGLYWQIQEDTTGQRLRSRSLWDFVLPLPTDALATGVIHRHELAGPGGARLVVQERPVVYPAPGGPRTLRIAVAVDAASLAAARADFARDLVPALAALALFLCFAAWAQVWFGLRPLEAVRRGIGAVRTRAQRRLEGRFPDEIMPLVNEVNALLAAQEQAMERARHRAADLAHGLKTPLTVVLSDAEKLRRRGEGELATELEDIARAMQRHIDRELARARVAADLARAGVAADLAAVVEAVVATLRRTPRGAGLDWSLSLPRPCPVAVDGADLTEMVGNLLDNAAKWARGGVDVTAEAAAEAEGIALSVADDGPGVPAERIDALGRRGVRLDEQTPGTGMGLAIVRDIAAAYGGGLALRNRPEGGLRVTLTLPRAQACHAGAGRP